MDKLTVLLLVSFFIFINYMASMIAGYGAGIVTFVDQCHAGIGIGLVTNQSNFIGYPLYVFNLPTCPTNPTTAK